MRDPYLYANETVLRNKLDIHDQQMLDDAEADYVSFRLKDLVMNPIPGDYDIDHLMAMHEFIFQDLYEWAGKPRIISIYKEEPVLGGQSIEYSDPFDIVSDIKHVLLDANKKQWTEMDRQTLADTFSDFLAELWKIHPFREGNTRTTVTFCCQFIEDKGIDINRTLFEKTPDTSGLRWLHIMRSLPTEVTFQKKSIYDELFLTRLRLPEREFSFALSLKYILSAA